jgi:hypothetical protein
MENLTRFMPMVAKDGSAGMLKSDVGSYVRFSDAEEKINSLQQAQAKIYAIVSDWAEYRIDGMDSATVSIVAKELRKLSAVR